MKNSLSIRAPLITWQKQAVRVAGDEQGYDGLHTPASSPFSNLIVLGGNPELNLPPRHQPNSRSKDYRTIFMWGLGCLSLLVTGCLGDASRSRPENNHAKSELHAFLLEGRELHPSLRTPPAGSLSDLPGTMMMPKNPHVSADTGFIEATARGGSQGRLGGDEMRAALYARYATEQAEIGVYGLEARSIADADTREKALREIWAHNESLDRTRVYRRGNILFVVWIWTNSALPEAWNAVKQSMEQRLRLHREAE